MKNNPVCSLLSICAKGRKVVSGGFSTERAIKDGTASVVIIATDASDNTKKKFSDMCSYRDIPLYFCLDKDTLGHCIGNEMRTSVAVLDQGLANSIISKLESEVNGGDK